MIRNIIFDVGKVLVSYEPDAYMQRLGISKENQKKINEAMFQNKLWDTSDQGLGILTEIYCGSTRTGRRNYENP